MDGWELLTTSIDELYDMGILQEPEPEHHIKMCTLTFTCCACGQEYTERYQRNNPDQVSRGMSCLSCQTPTMFLEHAVPFTLFYRSRGMEYGSCYDDVSRECWYCGATEGLYATTLSNKQEVKLCALHLKPFAKEAYTASRRKQAILTSSHTVVWTDRTQADEPFV